MDLGTGLDSAMPQLVVIGLLLYLLSVALHYAALAVEASREAAVQTRDAELRALKSQINPHFLFNCLNSISGCSTSGGTWQSEQASSTCISTCKRAPKRTCSTSRYVRASSSSSPARPLAARRTRASSSGTASPPISTSRSS